MKQIWKFPLNFDHTKKITINVPASSKILTVKSQNDTITLWILVDPDSSMTETRKFEMIGTGWDIDSTDNMIYIGSVLVEHDQYVWHIFEIP